MVDEKDLHREERWHLERLAEKAIKALKRNNFDVEFVANRGIALQKVIDRVPPEATIGCGDSVTLHQIGLIDWFENQKEREIFNPFSIQRDDFPGGDWARFRTERFRLQQKALTANVFVTGINAITLDGKLVNIDGHGNRVAAQIFGPNKVIFVCGANKIVKDVDTAVEKILMYTAPINTRRHVEKHNFPIDDLPCAMNGICSKCHHSEKTCRITTIIDGWSRAYHCQSEYQPTIIIVGESLGI